MSNWRTVIVPAFIGFQAFVIHYGLRENAPTAPDLSQFPAQFSDWRKFSEDPPQAEIAAVLNADEMLSRNYVNGKTGTFANLFVAWFRSQRDGARQPHSPKVCLP